MVAPKQEAGIYSLPEEQYRSAEGISKSDLDWIAPPRTPAHYKAKKDGLISNEATPAMRTGALLHRSVLEPETMQGAFVERPDGLSLVTKEGKAFKEANEGKIILSADDADGIRGMARAVLNHETAGRVLTGSRMEQCLFAEDSHGTMRKGRIDILPAKGNVIADLKTCASADRDEFERSVAKYRYYVQAAYYLDLCKLAGLGHTQFLFICVEKTPPYCVAVYAIDSEAIDAGRSQYQRDIALVRHCQETGKWPGFGGEIGSVGLPEWMMKQIERIAA